MAKKPTNGQVVWFKYNEREYVGAYHEEKDTFWKTDKASFMAMTDRTEIPVGAEVFAGWAVEWWREYEISND